MAERGDNRWISGEKRSGGTLQVSRWRFGGPPQRRGLFVAVTRQDAPWCRVADRPEGYAMAVVLDDRGRADANLYAEVRGVLQARVGLRIRL